MLSHNFKKPNYEMYLSQKTKLYTSCQGVFMKMLNEGNFQILKDTIEKIMEREISFTIQCKINRTKLNVIFRSIVGFLRIVIQQYKIVCNKFEDNLSMMWKEKLAPQNIEQQLKKIDKQIYHNNVQSIEEKPNEEAKQYSLDMEFGTEESSFNRSKSLKNRSKKSKSTESPAANKISIHVQNLQEKQKIQESPKAKVKKNKINNLKIPDNSLNLGKKNKSQQKLNFSQKQLDKSTNKKEPKRNTTPQNKVHFFFSNNLLGRSLNLSDMKDTKNNKKLINKKKKFLDKNEQLKIKLNLPKELLLDNSCLNSARSRQHKKKTK